MTRPLRFLQVTSFYPPYNFGGDGIYVSRLSRALAERGHRVDVVHCVDAYRLVAGKTAPPPGDPVTGHPNLVVHALQSGWGWLSPLLSHQTGRPLLKRRALERITNRGVDVIHFHNVSLFGPTVFSLGRDLPSVTFYTTHEHWLICPTHVLWKFDRERCEKPTCLRCTLATGRPPQLWRYTGLLDRAARDVDCFLSPSRFTAQMHASRGFRHPVTHLAPFSARADGDWKDPGPRLHPRPYFLYVGRLEPVKGIASLLDAWTRDAVADLVVVGAGSEATRVQAAADRNPAVTFVGPLAEDQLGRYYTHAVATLVPSLVFEVAPTVVLESFARRTPVIARAIGGAAELVRDADGGLLYETQSELVSALARLAHDRRLREHLGERGYSAFCRSWTEEAHITAYLSLVDRTAKKKLGGTPWST